ncbi:hypothetical protein [Paenibacillus daejeonensis]|uniref:hypothetical protein n=1 Tax=Paenibacillus daejeonensis TaxID=135193 RepID=UPI00035FD348|nr:hypothetical protein [Paenibacillus daejeonensis]
MPNDKKEHQLDADHEGRQAYEMDIDRMVNEGLGGGQVTRDNGLIEETTTSTMKGDQQVSESSLDRDDL